MFVVDTNVFVYAADAHAREHARCRALVERWRAEAEPWFTTWNVLYEFLRVVTHPRVFRTPLTLEQAWRFVEAILASPGLTVLEHTPRHASVAALFFSERAQIQGNLLHDAHTAVLMREHGIRRIYTRDADFHRFGQLEVIDPMAV